MSDQYERAVAQRKRIADEQARLRHLAADIAGDPGNEELWRELCRARATLRALARCG